MATDFENFVSAALDAFYAGDWLPTMALADYLHDRGDERAVRLRRRLATVRKRLERVAETIAIWHANPRTRGPEGERGLELLKYLRSDLIAGWVSYFVRLMSVGPGERVPRKTLGGSYCIAGPD